MQASRGFPVPLTEKYRPRQIADFAGLDKAKRIFTKFVSNPYPSAWLFVGPSGTGKTTFAQAIAEAIPAETRHIGSQDCNVENLERAVYYSQYVPMSPNRMHLILIDEADQMSPAAQLKSLSYLDSTCFSPATVFIFTANATDRLQDRFLSRCRVVEFSTYGLGGPLVELLDRVWHSEGGNGNCPNLARIVKDSTNNARESLMRLEVELLTA